MDKILEFIKSIFSEQSGVLFALVVLFAGILLGCLFQYLCDRKKISRERKDAVARSRAVLGGQFAEQIAPFLPGFPCNPGDVKFIGKPVDFVAFPGSAEGRKIEEVVFIEVKTGESKLSNREKEIRQAVENKKVRYVVYEVNKN